MARPEATHSGSEDENMTDAPVYGLEGTNENGNGANDSYQDTPDYTDSDTNPNTTASSVAGDAAPADGRKRRLEAFALRKSMYGKKHSALGESKENDTIRRFRYLLGLTDLFRHFIDASSNPKVRDIITEIDRQNAEEAAKGGKQSGRVGGASGRHRRTEKEEDAELLRNEKKGGQPVTIFRESPAYIQGGEMRDYQVEGLNWLISLHENGISGILADEMGLGKTLQTISFLGYLRHNCGIKGPHLIAVPKSTLNNWEREFHQWSPEVNVLVLQGAKEDRAKLISERFIDEDFDVCVTSYEMILREKTHLKRLAWRYIIIDEAHRIKNEESSLARNMREFNSQNRLLITGTPLQNNLHELWALLNFLLPDVFGDAEVFDQWFSSQSEDEDTVIQQLHRVLKPFLLRRVKADVEKSLLPKKEVHVPIGMTEMQVQWYKKILEKDIDAVNGANGKKESKTRLLNIVMQLRKCCNHPYLFDGAEKIDPENKDLEHLIYNAGKMKVLDKLLKRMKAEGSRVLIFSQMSRVLDILEDYCFWRNHEYCRIDGGTAHEDRIQAIDEYNKPNSEKFLFLLTTRAGGLGINLTSANVVILFDSDWNPQADLQAQDRAHRIGQTKQVWVYRFVTEKAIEERVLERAAQKLRLDQVVIQQGRAQQTANQAASKDDLLDMIQHGADEIVTKGATLAGTNEVTDEDLDAILARGQERTKDLNSKYEKLGLDELQNFASNSALEWDGVDWTKKEKKEISVNWINPSKRERNQQTYSIDGYYKNALATGGRTADTKPKAPRPPKQVTIHDYQFFDPRLEELQDRETAWFRKEIGYKVPLPEKAEMSDEEKEQERALEQEEIDSAVPLNDEDKALKDRLSEEGFGNWNRRDFQQFINGSAKFGRKNWPGVATEVDGKTEKEIKTYAEVFWNRYTEITDYQKHLDNIDKGEKGRNRLEHQRKMLKKKLDMYRVPLQQLKLNYSVSTTNKKVYTEEEDRFLLVKLQHYGVDSENVYENIRDEIRDGPLFKFDWFFLSRAPDELRRRCRTLLETVAREMEGDGTNGIVKSRARDEEDAPEEDKGPTKKKAKTVKNKPVAAIKGGGSKATTAQTSRATSVTSNGSKSGAKGKAKGKKK